MVNRDLSSSEQTKLFATISEALQHATLISMHSFLQLLRLFKRSLFVISVSFFIVTILVIYQEFGTQDLSKIVIGDHKVRFNELNQAESGSESDQETNAEPKITPYIIDENIVDSDELWNDDEDSLYVDSEYADSENGNPENQENPEPKKPEPKKMVDDERAERAKMNARFRRRKVMLDRVCSILPSIAEMKRNGTTFEDLLEFHKKIYDVHSSWNHKETRKCKPPRRSKQNAIFKVDHMNLLICLPPKCGTTNYQKALAPLIDGFDVKTRTTTKVAEDFHAPSVYDILRRVTPIDFVEWNDKYHRYYKTINVRHPFTRLYSAWNDKFRTFLNEAGKVDFKVDANNFAHRKEHVRLYHEVYYPGIQLFEDSQNPPDYMRNVTFEAFVEYLVANPSQSSYNWHWRSFFWHCSPCHFKYNYVTHLEDSEEEGPWLLNTWRVDKLTHLPAQYMKSPLKSHGPEYYWRNVPQDTIKELYRVFYEDFIMFDYSPDSVLAFVQAGNKERKPATQQKKDQSRKMFQSHRDTQSTKHDFLMCNWYTDEEKYEVLGKERTYSKSGNQPNDY